MADGFVELASHTTPRNDTGSSTFTAKRDGDQLRFYENLGCAGVGSVYTSWEGSVDDFRQACQMAIKETGEAETCVLKLTCRRIAYDNDDSLTGREPQPETCDCAFTLPTQFVRSLLDQLTPPLA